MGALFSLNFSDEHHSKNTQPFEKLCLGVELRLPLISGGFGPGVTELIIGKFCLLLAPATFRATSRAFCNRESKVSFQGGVTLET